MNIFFLDKEPATCAKMHCDKHVVKMIIEYAQLMSTAHRLLDGKKTIENVKGRKIARWVISENNRSLRDEHLYKASHVNHPSAVWVRESSQNYLWLYSMWVHLLQEYTFRYGKTHLSEKLLFILANVPENIRNREWSDPPPAMPDECKVINNKTKKYDSLLSYRNYYIDKKSRFAKWTKRETPSWYTKGLSLLTYAESISSP